MTKTSKFLLWKKIQTFSKRQLKSDLRVETICNTKPIISPIFTSHITNKNIIQSVVDNYTALQNKCRKAQCVKNITNKRQTRTFLMMKVNSKLLNFRLALWFISTIHLATWHNSILVIWALIHATWFKLMASCSGSFWGHALFKI